MYRTKCKLRDFKCKWYFLRVYSEKKTIDERAMDKLGVWQVFQLNVLKKEFYFMEGFAQSPLNFITISLQFHSIPTKYQP